MTNYNMQTLYEAIGENIITNPQLFGLENYFRKSNHITIVGFGNGLSTLLAIKQKPTSIIVYDQNAIEINDYVELAHDHGINLVYKNISIIDQPFVENTDLLFIDSFAEGNFIFNVCDKFKDAVSRFIVINNTYKHAHQPDPSIRLGNNAQPVGCVFGINHFIQTNDSWHIAENLYWEPGLTILYRRKDYTDVLSNTTLL